MATPPCLPSPISVYAGVAPLLLPLGEGGDELAVEVRDVGHDAAPDRVKGVGKRPNTSPSSPSDSLKRFRVGGWCARWCKPRAFRGRKERAQVGGPSRAAHLFPSPNSSASLQPNTSFNFSRCSTIHALTIPSACGSSSMLPGRYTATRHAFLPSGLSQLGARPKSCSADSLAEASSSKRALFVEASPRSM